MQYVSGRKLANSGKLYRTPRGLSTLFSGQDRASGWPKNRTFAPLEKSCRLAGREASNT